MEKKKLTIAQMKKSVERRRFLIQGLFSVFTNSYITGFLKGTIYQGKLKYVCVPGMNCYSCPGAWGSCPIGALQAVLNDYDSTKIWVDSATNTIVKPPLYWFAFYIVGFLMIVGALCGRLICGFLCPFGLIQDLLHKIPLPKKMKIKTFPGDKPLRYLKYVILVVFVIGLPLLYKADPWFCKYICPSGMLIGGIPLMSLGKAVSWADAGTLTALKLTILGVIVLSSIVIYRPFCKYLCPLGAIYGLFNKVSLYRYYVDESKCTNCGACKHACRMGVDMTKTPNSIECIRCGDCKASCPHHAICSGFGKKKTLSFGAQPPMINAEEDSSAQITE